MAHVGCRGRDLHRAGLIAVALLLMLLGLIFDSERRKPRPNQLKLCKLALLLFCSFPISYDLPEVPC
jgi:hypothetical protein